MMETAVLWIYQEVKAHGVLIEAGQKPSLCLRGRKHMLCVVAGHPVRVLKRSVKEFDKARRVRYKDQEYPVQRALDTLIDMGTRNGITAKASTLLDRVRASTEVNEEEFTDEEEVTTIVSPEPPEDAAEHPRSKNRTHTTDGRRRSNGEGRSNLLASICTELKIEPTVARRKLRKVGLSAPYNNEVSIRKALS